MYTPVVTDKRKHLPSLWESPAAFKQSQRDEIAARRQARGKVLLASLESYPGYLADVADSAGLSIADTSFIAVQLVRERLLCALDGEPWAPTVKGYAVLHPDRVLHPHGAVQTASHRLAERKRLRLLGQAR